MVLVLLELVVVGIQRSLAVLAERLEEQAVAAVAQVEWEEVQSLVQALVEVAEDMAQAEPVLEDRPVSGVRMPPVVDSLAGQPAKPVMGLLVYLVIMDVATEVAVAAA